MNIGVLGGTFDPVHRGHLIVAEEARTRLDLAEIIFVPAGQPWLKVNSHITPAEHRVAMVRLAIKGKPYFKLSTMEIERPGPSYTVDTMAELKNQFGEKVELFFILGCDSFTEFPRWHQPARLITLCRLVVVPRPGCPPPDLNGLETALPGLSARAVLLDKPEVDISATGIRERVARGLSLADLVPRPVEKYIKQHKLYQVP